MALRFSPGTSVEDKARIQRALEKAAKKDSRQAALLDEMGGAVEIRMAEPVFPHSRFELDPLEGTLSINSRVDMTDEQLAEGIMTRLVSARQSGLQAPVQLVEKPRAAGSLSQEWNNLAKPPQLDIRMSRGIGVGQAPA